MPELPEVETVCRGLNQLTLQQKIRGAEVLLERSIAYPNSADEFLEGITGSAIALWHRRGKYLLAQLHPGGWLGVHLRMSGQLLSVAPETALHKHTRVRLFLDQELRFVDTRTFGKMWWIPPNQEINEIIPGLKKLGVEPLSPEFTVSYLENKLKSTRRTIKTVLLDQAVIAGIGNIYADESLFVSRIRPDTAAFSLTSAQLEQLHQAIIKVLQTSIDKGGTTFSSFLNVMGVNGNYLGQAWVYGRTGVPCRVCGATIERIKLAGRSTHFCPLCQE